MRVRLPYWKIQFASLDNHDEPGDQHQPQILAGSLWSFGTDSLIESTTPVRGFDHTSIPNVLLASYRSFAAGCLEFARYISSSEARVNAGAFSVVALYSWYCREVSGDSKKILYQIEEALCQSGLVLFPSRCPELLPLNSSILSLVLGTLFVVSLPNN